MSTTPAAGRAPTTRRRGTSSPATPAGPTTPAAAPKVVSAPPTALSDSGQDALAACETALADPDAFAAWLQECGTGTAGHPHDNHLRPLAAWLTINAGAPVAVSADAYRLVGDLHHARPLPPWAVAFCAALRSHQPEARYGNIARPITGIRALQLLQESAREVAA